MGYIKFFGLEVVTGLVSPSTSSNVRKSTKERERFQLHGQTIWLSYSTTVSGILYLL